MEALKREIHDAIDDALKPIRVCASLLLLCVCVCVCMCVFCMWGDVVVYRSVQVVRGYALQWCV
jgi:hypothetical protein